MTVQPGSQEEAQDRPLVRVANGGQRWAATEEQQAPSQTPEAAATGAPLPLAQVVTGELARLISGILGELQEAAGEEDATSSEEEQEPAGAAAAPAAGPAREQQQGSSPPHRIPSASRAAFPRPPHCAFLRPGQAFEGRQRVAHHGNNPKHEHWEVHAVIQHYDTERGYVAGTMEAANVPDAPAPVTTFFEGAIIDNVNHTFYTADWDACADTDFKHWSMFEPFRALRTEVVRHGGRCPSLASHPYIYMRWKEQFFLRGSECRLTIAGFYYLAIHRVSGAVMGLYYDPTSSPDQKLDLTAVRAGPAGYAFPHYDLA